MPFKLFSSSSRVIIVFSSSWYRMIFSHLPCCFSGLMFPCRASGVAISCCLLSGGLFLASANAYRALGVVISSSHVVSWFASCIG